MTFINVLREDASALSGTHRLILPVSSISRHSDSIFSLSTITNSSSNDLWGLLLLLLLLLSLLLFGGLAWDVRGGGGGGGGGLDAVFGVDCVRFGAVVRATCAEWGLMYS